MKQLQIIPNIIILFLIGLFALPLIYLILGGFYNSPFISKWDSITLSGFSLIFKNDSLINALTESLLLGFASAIVGVLISVLYLSQFLFANKKESSLTTTTLSFPLAMPDILWGLSIVFLAKLFSIGLGFNLVFIIHICFNVVLSYVFLKPIFITYPKSQIKSSSLLGASRLNTIADIVLPNIKKQLLVVFIMCFLYSYDDFLLTYLIGGSNTTTLPLYLYSKLRFGASSSIIAIASLTTILNIILSFLILTLTKNRIYER